jgi:hypothetical protein
MPQVGAEAGKAAAVQLIDALMPRRWPMVICVGAITERASYLQAVPCLQGSSGHT